MLLVNIGVTLIIAFQLASLELGRVGAGFMEAMVVLVIINNSIFK